MDNSIKITDQGELLEIAFADVHRFHGPGSLAGAALGFKACQAALEALCPADPPARIDLSIVSGHPGPGVRDAFELVSRVVTRGAYVVDTTRPVARWNPYQELSFSFVVKVAGGRLAEVVLEQHVLPPRFFELLHLSALPAATQAVKQELRELKKSLAARIVGTPTGSLFTVTVAS